MLKAGLKTIFFLFVLCYAPAVLGQSDEMDRALEQEEGEQKEKEKEIDPKIGLWQLKEYGAFQDSLVLDTLHDYFHIFHPIYKDAITATYTGNYGSPVMDNNFFNRGNQSNYFFGESRNAYFLTPEKIRYYNTRTPYTRFDYSQSENKSKNNETRFNVIHSQNINPWWNATLNLNLAKSQGQYQSQEAKNNSVAFNTSYAKDEWMIHAGFITNSIENEENGGLTSDSVLIADKKNAEFWNVKLKDSKTNLSSNYFFLNAERRFGKYIETETENINEEGEVVTEKTFRPIMGISYSFEYNRNKHEFSEDEEVADANNVWTNTHFGDTYKKDSIRFNRLRNVVQLKQYENSEKKYSFGKRAFLGYELDRGSMPGTQVNDSVHARTDIKYSNLYVGGGIFRETGKFWRWNFDGKIYLNGRNSGQTELNGLVYKPIRFGNDSLASISFTGKIENRSPNFFQERFYSDHFIWHQNLKNEQRVTIGGAFKMPKRKFEIGAKYAVIDNYIYNNAEGIPSQTGDEILVLSAYIDKDFNYRRFHFRTRALWQKTTEERYIHLPELSAMVSAFYQFTISKVMFAQIGTDVRYNSKYYADVYSPANGLFYLQSEKKYGDYPYIDVYASLRLKRTRVFFKWMNIGTNFMDGEYITTPDYPMNRSTFRLGVSWAFYD